MKNVKIFAQAVDEKAMGQIQTLAQEKSFKDQQIRIMHDVHAGKGTVIGFTATMGDYVIPNVVGVDIGCGMLTIPLGQVSIDLEKLDQAIYQRIPSGRGTHKSPQVPYPALQNLKCLPHLTHMDRLENSIGTLGGGNHFIEVGENPQGDKYLIIHTGSRNLGTQVAEHYQKQAQIACRGEGVPKPLAYLTGQGKDDYLHDMKICQDYAVLNRHTMGNILLDVCQLPSLESGTFASFETIHNYIDLDQQIIRKGAIDASAGKKLLIPFNMRDGCMIGMGKGNPDWNYSAPHGAGRLMSRMAAKATFTMDQYITSMEGIFSTSIHKNTLDELPMAYKKPEDILNHIGDTVEILEMIKPIYNFKAGE